MKYAGLLFGFIAVLGLAGTAWLSKEWLFDTREIPEFKIERLTISGAQCLSRADSRIVSLDSCTATLNSNAGDLILSAFVTYESNSTGIKISKPVFSVGGNKVGIFGYFLPRLVDQVDITFTCAEVGDKCIASGFISSLVLR